MTNRKIQSVLLSGTRLCLVLLSVVVSSLGFSAKAIDTSDSQTLSVSEPGSEGRIVTERFNLYYFQDRIDLDEDYLDNQVWFDKINDYLARSPQIDSIVIYAYASPEGVYERNVWLSKKRAAAARDYILAHCPEGSALNPENIILRPMAENWIGLYEEVKANYHRSDRERVLKILENTNISNDTKKWRLQQLDGGYTYRYLIRHNMPRLRLATWICVWEAPAPLEPAVPSIPEQDEIVIEDEPIVIEDFAIDFSPTVIEFKPLKEKLTILALKTNLLYDLVTAVNAEIEVPIGDKFSLMVEDVFPWWTWGPNERKYAFQIWSIGAEPRWWFARNDRRDRLSGHFVGAYLMTAAYDIQNNYDYCYQGEYWSVGLSYGYSMPIGKILNMEFSIAAGFLNTDYRHYQPDPAYEHLYRDKFKVGNLSYFGPTKLKVSLVLPISITRRVR